MFIFVNSSCCPYLHFLIRELKILVKFSGIVLTSSINKLHFSKGCREERVWIRQENFIDIEFHLLSSFLSWRKVLAAMRVFAQDTKKAKKKQKFMIKLFITFAIRRKSLLWIALSILWKKFRITVNNVCYTLPRTLSSSYCQEVQHLRTIAPYNKNYSSPRC